MIKNFEFQISFCANLSPAWDTCSNAKSMFFRKQSRMIQKKCVNHFSTTTIETKYS